MTNEEIIEQLENTIRLINQNGKDWLDDRDISILEACIKSLTAIDKIRAEIIEQKDNVIPCIAYPADVYADGKTDAYNRCLKIIDKYRTEQTDAVSD